MISRYKKKQRQKKIFLIIALVICAMSILAFFSIGSYFYNIMLNRYSQKPLFDVKSEQSVINSDTENENALEAEIALAWSQSTLQTPLTITTPFDLHLQAIRYDSGDPDNHLWAILLHGYAGSSSDMIVQAKRFFDQGYNILIPDLRAHGNSEGHAIGMGWQDRSDLALWVNSITENDSEAQIVVYGVSIGANEALMAAGDGLPAQVLCIVSDSAYGNAWDLFSYRLKKIYNISEFPSLYSANIISRIRAGYSLKSADTITALEKATIPVLFIHGQKDTIVLNDIADEIYEAYKGPKKKYTMPGAGHTHSSLTSPQQYWETVFDFIKEYLPTEEE